MLLPVLLVLAGALLLFQYLKMVYVGRYSSKIPSVPPIYPILGSIPELRGKSSQQAFWFMAQSFRRTDRLAKLKLGPVPVLLVNHPDLLQQILTRNDLYDKPFMYDFMGLGNGLITERNGDEWLAKRKILNPTFNTRMLTGFLPIMDARVGNMVAALRPLASDGQRKEFDILKFVGECTLEIALGTTMGRNANELPGQRDYMRSLDRILTHLGERMLNFSHFFDVFYRMTGAWRSEKAARDVCYDFMEQIIRDRRVELEQEVDIPRDDDEYAKKTLNVLDQILAIKERDVNDPLDRDISENLSSVMAAAYDTSTLTVSYAFLFLAMFPDIQDKVLAEINAVFYDQSVEITLDTLHQLKYTEQVLKEVLRLCPAVPFAARQTRNDDLALDGIKIPRGQILIYNFYTLHRRSDIWGPDPERFDPDRFLPEVSQQRHPYGYLPFSGGMRNCIGRRYAMNSMRIMLLRVLQEFEIKTRLRYQDLRFRFEISMKLVGPHLVWLENRK